MSGDDLAWWRTRGTRLLPVLSRGTLATGEWWEDAYGELQAWLGGAGQTLLLVRPDRFCMAAFAPEEAGSALGEARRLLA